MRAAFSFRARFDPNHGTFRPQGILRTCGHCPPTGDTVAWETVMRSILVLADRSESEPRLQAALSLARARVAISPS
jgi:hypothetical protein